MNLQIFGTKKCSNTKKAEMFFKERRIPFQSINILEKPMSKGELEAVLRTVNVDDLMDTESKNYKDQNLAYYRFDKKSKLLESPEVMKTPVVRDGNRATVGYKPEIWKTWIGK